MEMKVVGKEGPVRTGSVAVSCTDMTLEDEGQQKRKEEREHRRGAHIVSELTMFGTEAIVHRVESDPERLARLRAKSEDRACAVSPKASGK